MASKLHCDLCDGLIDKDKYPGGGLITEWDYVDDTTSQTDLCDAHLRSYQQMLKTWRTQQQGGYINPLTEWPQKKVGARA